MEITSYVLLWNSTMNDCVHQVTVEWKSNWLTVRSTSLASDGQLVDLTCIVVQRLGLNDRAIEIAQLSRVVFGKILSPAC